MNTPVSRIATAPIVGVGVLLSFVGLALPWFATTTRTSETLIRPLSESVLAPAAVFVVIGLVGGTAVAIAKGSVGLLGCFAAILFNASACVWLFGAAVLAWLPSSLRPDNPVLSLEIGVSSVLIGSLLILAGCASTLVDVTWSRRTGNLIGWSFVGATAVAFAAVFGRGMPVVRARASGFEWSLSAEQVPLLGDLQGLLGLSIAVLVLAVTVFKRRILSVILVGVATMYAATSVLLVVAGGLLKRAADAAAGRLGYDQADVTAHFGASTLGVAASIGAVVVAVTVMRTQTSNSSFGAAPVDSGFGGVVPLPPAGASDSRPSLPF